MNWIELSNAPLWRALWNSDEMVKREAGWRDRLLAGNITDPHELGMLRGQLKAMTELRAFVERMANETEKRATAADEAPEPQGRWAQRVLGRVMR